MTVRSAIGGPSVAHSFLLPLNRLLSSLAFDMASPLTLSGPGRMGTLGEGWPVLEKGDL